jgi:hypothetical protein
MAEYYIAIEHRELADGRTVYSVTVGQKMRKTTVEQGDGFGCIHRPAETHDEAVSHVCEILDGYRDPEWRQDDRSAPAADNTALRDETGEFSMAEFFERGTLAAYMQQGEPR